MSCGLILPLLSDHELACVGLARTLIGKGKKIRESRKSLIQR